MNVARYVGGGRVEIVNEPQPVLPEGGLLVETEACGLCSGELMEWYMDQKVPHVLGHEVAGRVIASDDDRFPVGARVFPHHHAPCGDCDPCRLGRPVHCPTWRKTRLVPGGMAERFAVPAANLRDTWVVDDLRAVDAALIEPVACVAKSLGTASDGPAAVVGLGVMGLMHLRLLGDDAVGYDTNPRRVEWAKGLGIDARIPPDADALARRERFETVFVCPGSQAAFDFGLDLVREGGTVVMFAPMPPGTPLQLPPSVYFRDLKIHHAYSCGPGDCAAAVRHLREGRLRAEQVVTHFVGLDALPSAYQAMKRGEILKAMVVFPA